MNFKLFLFIAFSLLLVIVAGININVQYKKSITSKVTIKSDNYRFIRKPCWFDADWKETIDCGELHTPTTKNAFVLPVVIIKADEKKQPDPIVYLQGGPGAGARLDSEGIKNWLSWKRYTNTQRDLILVDVRGTGRSKPAINCEDYNRFNHQLLTQDVTLKEELSWGYTQALNCLKRQKKVNPDDFSTEASAIDIRALMAQLNYSEWNILAVSYGTRLALEIARLEQESMPVEKDYPQKTKLKSMILDSVYPAGVGGVQAWPKLLDEAMQGFFSGCALEQHCRNSLANLSEPVIDNFMKTLEVLAKNPKRLTIKRWDREAPIDFLVNDHRFLSASFSATYQPSDWYKIIDAMLAVREGSEEKLESLIEPYLNQSFSKNFNSLTFSLVDCADNPVQPEADYLTELEKYPLFKTYVQDQWTFQLCHGLPSKELLKRVPPQVPTLILAGEQDPITPVSWAKDLRHTWSHVQLRILKDSAHSVLATNTCLLEHIDDFFNHPEQEFVQCR